jgi:hypothetical protein
VYRVRMKAIARVLAGTLLAVGFGLFNQPPATYAADEIALDGTLDCGANSEDYCPIRDRIKLITASVSGVKEPISIHIDWIKDQWIDSLPLQDDYYVLQVIPRPAGGFRAIGILDHLTIENLDSKRDPRDGRDQSDRRSDEKTNSNKGNH